MESLSQLKSEYENLRSKNLNLNIERGQPADENFDVANPILSILTENDVVTPSNVAIRNYPGGVAGLKEIREICGEILGVDAKKTFVGNNTSLGMIVNTIMWALIKGLKDSDAPWSTIKPKVIVTTPGYDRHFNLLEQLGIDIITVEMQGDGPDVDAIEKIVAEDDTVKGLLFVPTYSNPTGETISDRKVERLAQMKTAAKDFTIFADDAYAIHHLYEKHEKSKSLIIACEEAGNSSRAYVFGSTSKITFSGGGIGFMATGTANVDFMSKLLTAQSIGPNKIEQYRHVKFFNSFPHGVSDVMKKHASILRPKFTIAEEILQKELSSLDLATWTKPNGGYFISLNTKEPIAKRVVALAKDVGVLLTPAGATFPKRHDPKDSNIRIAPTHPTVDEVGEAIKVLCLCIKLAHAEYRA